MLLNVARRRVERELDVVYFIRKQLILGALIKAMTTKLQRNLAKRQYGLILGEKKEQETTPDSASEFEFPKAISDTETNQALVNGLRKFRHKSKAQPQTSVT